MKKLFINKNTLSNTVSNVIVPMIWGINNKESFTNIVLSILFGLSIILLFKIMFKNNN